MTVFIGAKDWARPSFRRRYYLLLLGIAVVVGLLLTHLVPTGTLSDCTVISVERNREAVASATIVSSCGTHITFRGGADFLRDGVAYDFQMKGIFIRHVDAWVESGG